MNKISANQFLDVYAAMGLDPQSRGCIMIDTEPVIVNDVIPAWDLYSDESTMASGADLTPESELEPHVTLLYGLMEPGPAMQVPVDAVLHDWTMPAELEIEDVGFFYGNPAEPNVAIVAHIKVTDELLEGNQRLRLLPHIDTFPDYQPHLTLAYVKDSAPFAEYAVQLKDKLIGVKVKTMGLNYGH